VVKEREDERRVEIAQCQRRRRSMGLPLGEAQEELEGVAVALNRLALRGNRWVNLQVAEGFRR
jgi:hypothetical protein